LFVTEIEQLDLSTHIVGFAEQNSPQDFLDLQNAARVGVGIGMLTWDSTVAAYAHGYATKRIKDCKKIYSGGPYGENIFQGARGISWTASDALFAWLKQKKYYNCTSNTCKNRQTCDHLGQLNKSWLCKRSLL
jgi:pathogenesis-related protein 1